MTAPVPQPPYVQGDYASQVPGAEEGILEQVNIKDYWRVIWAGRWIISAIVVVAVVTATILSFLATPQYRATATISIETRTPNIIANQINTSPSWYEIERYMNEQRLVLKSRNLGARVVERLQLDKHPGFKGSRDPAAQFISMVLVQPVRESNVFQLSMEGADRKDITLWVNTLVDEYVRNNIEESMKSTQKVYAVIQSKLDPLRADLVKSEERLSGFKAKQENFFFDTESKNVLSDQLEILSKEYSTAKADRISTESRVQALRSLQARGGSIESFPEMMANLAIQTLNGERTRVEVELSELLKTYKEEYPKVKDLRAQLKTISSRLYQEIGKIVNSLQAEYEVRKRREDALFSNIQSLRGESLDLGKQGLEYNKIKGDYDQNKAFYEQMMQRSKEADISGTTAINNIHIIDPAILPDFAVKPNKRRNVMLALLASLAIGIGVVFLVDFMDSSIKTPEDIERYLNLHVLSTIPIYKPERTKVIRELYQTLRTGLIFSRQSAGSQVILLTSTGPGEGKTTTSFNLAKIMAAAGDRVVLVDCDLRKPAVHKHLGVQNLKGVSNYLYGNATLQEITRVTTGGDLHVLTTGPIPPNPPEMFGKREFQKFIEELRANYDWVILDSPPVMSVTDPVIMCSSADMVLMVVQYNQVDRRVARHSLKALRRAGGRIVGAVLNNVDIDRDAYYSDTYYSYYRAGYYGDESPSPKGAIASIKSMAGRGKRAQPAGGVKKS